MTACESCGRKPQNGVSTHWVGCPELEAAPTPLRRGPEPPAGGTCEHGECANDKRPQGKGRKPKYCTEHSDPKNRK